MRKTLTSLLYSLPLLMAVAASSQAMDKIAPAAALTAQTEGKVRVIIMTRADSTFKDGGNAFRRPAAYLSKQLSLPARDVRPIGQLPMVSATVSADSLGKLREDPNVAYVFRDELRKAQLFDTVESTGAQKHDDAGFDGKGWTVAVLDSGVDTRHPAFKGAIVGEACFSLNYSGDDGTKTSFCPGGKEQVIGKGAGVNCDMSFSEMCLHGTHVAGIVAGRPVKLKNGKVVHGMAPGANLLAVQVFGGVDSEQACGQQKRCILSSDSDILRALEWVYSLRNEYKIAAINMSLGGGKFTEPCDSQTPYADTIAKLRAAGIATVISAGNEAEQEAIGMPACVSTAVSVSATKKDGTIDVNYSNVARFVTVAAPGTQIFSAIPGRRYLRLDGTSMAAPHVAGAIAVLREEKPERTVDTIVKLLQRAGQTVSDPRTGTKLRRMDLARIRIPGGETQSAIMTEAANADDASYDKQQQLLGYGDINMRTVIIQSPLPAEELKAKIGEACKSSDDCKVEKIGGNNYVVTVPFAVVEQLTGEGTLAEKLDKALGDAGRVFQDRLNRPMLSDAIKNAEEAE